MEKVYHTVEELKDINILKGRYYVVCPDLAYAKLVIEKLYHLGAKRNGLTSSETFNVVRAYKEEKLDKEDTLMLEVGWGGHDGDITFNYSPKDRPSFIINWTRLSLDDLYTLGRCNKEIKLNDKYTAFVKEDHVQVGCQKIPFEKVEELYNTIKNR